MMGAAAVGMAPANGGLTTGHQAAAQVVTVSGFPPETEETPHADPAHEIHLTMTTSEP